MASAGGPSRVWIRRARTMVHVAGCSRAAGPIAFILSSLAADLLGQEGGLANRHPVQRRKRDRTTVDLHR